MQGFGILIAISPSPATSGSDIATILPSPAVAVVVALPAMTILPSTASQKRRKSSCKLLNKSKKRAASLAANEVPATVIDSTMVTGDSSPGAVTSAPMINIASVQPDEAMTVVTGNEGLIFYCDGKMRLEYFLMEFFWLRKKKVYSMKKIGAGMRMICVACFSSGNIVSS